MKWNKYTIRTKASVEDIIAAALDDIGIEGVEIEDSLPLTKEELSQMFVDIPAKSDSQDDTALIHFYLDPETDNENVLKRVKEELENLKAYSDIGDGSILESQTEDVDWINNWKEHFHRFYVDEFCIVPSWEEIEQTDGDKIVLHIDPGTAFGTGMHETTQLCLRQLKKHTKAGDQILDVGTGSGILSIAALKLGAKSAVGTDLDPCAISAAEENKIANDVPDGDLKLLLGNIIDDAKIQESVGFEKYDIAVANILAEVLAVLAPQVIKHLKTGGVFIASGILDTKEGEVKAAFASAGFELLEVSRQGEWVSITARK